MSELVAAVVFKSQLMLESVVASLTVLQMALMDCLGVVISVITLNCAAGFTYIYVCRGVCAEIRYKK